MCRGSGGTGGEKRVGQCLLSPTDCTGPSWACSPASRGQPLQRPQEAARTLQALQVLLVGGDLQRREKTVVGGPSPDSAHWVGTLTAGLPVALGSKPQPHPTGRSDHGDRGDGGDLGESRAGMCPVPVGCLRWHQTFGRLCRLLRVCHLLLPTASPCTVSGGVFYR